jgi:hypothetical protein
VLFCTQFYSAFAGRAIKADDAQAALEALWEANLAWKAVQGDDALEDESMTVRYHTEVEPTMVAGPATQAHGPRATASKKSAQAPKPVRSRKPA